MADYFNVDKFAEEMDTVSLTQNQKEILLDKMRKFNENANSDKSSKKIKLNYSVWIKSVAAALVVAMIFGGVFVYTNSINAKNSFVVVASAAELPESELNDAIVGAFSDGGRAEFAMYDFDYVDVNNPLYSTHLLNEQGKIDYFNFFNLSELNIVGKNIESVTFKANKKFTYFSIEPYYHAEKSLEEILSMFTNCDTLSNSQYDKNAGDGFNGYCDSFTYKNPDISNEEQTLELGGYISFVVESDRTDEEIDEYVKKIEEVYSAYKTVDTPDETTSAKMNEELMNEITKSVGEIDKKTLHGATIDITVNFADGSSQTKVLNVDFYQKVEDGVYYSPQIVLSYAD
ncbi:MAG: hypothetical protein J1E85_05360 [Ruminococcus sp.]|nr:hypothetical protein [Ruminococcus sp.]